MEGGTDAECLVRWTDWLGIRQISSPVSGFVGLLGIVKGKSPSYASHRRANHTAALDGH